MIFYFSATGNSKLVAEYLGKILQQETCDMNRECATNLSLDKTVGIVFPVHAWGIPYVIQDYIPKIQSYLSHASYVFVILCCGDDVGYCDTQIRDLLHQYQVKVAAFFSVAMPNTYIGMPGFDVDSSALQRFKLEHARIRLHEIAMCIDERKVTTDVIRGSYPHLKSGAIRKLFNRFMIKDNYFKVNTKLCINCKRCGEVCPMHNISFNPYPTWNHNCLTCFACFHVCPKQAIRFTLSGGKKRQYHAPESL